MCEEAEASDLVDWTILHGEVSSGSSVAEPEGSQMSAVMTSSEESHDAPTCSSIAEDLEPGTFRDEPGSSHNVSSPRRAKSKACSDDLNVSPLGQPSLVAAAASKINSKGDELNEAKAHEPLAAQATPTCANSDSDTSESVCDFPEEGLLDDEQRVAEAEAEEEEAAENEESGSIRQQLRRLVLMAEAEEGESPRYSFIRRPGVPDDSPMLDDVDDRCESDLSPEARDDSPEAVVNALPQDPETRRHYRHTPNSDLNWVLTVVAGVVLAVGFGVGVGHCIGSHHEHHMWAEVNQAQAARLQALEQEISQCRERAFTQHDSYERLVREQASMSRERQQLQRQASLAHARAEQRAQCQNSLDAQERRLDRMTERYESSLSYVLRQRSKTEADFLQCKSELSRLRSGAKPEAARRLDDDPILHTGNTELPGEGLVLLLKEAVQELREQNSRLEQHVSKLSASHAKVEKTPELAKSKQNSDALMFQEKEQKTRDSKNIDALSRNRKLDSEANSGWFWQNWQASLWRTAETTAHALFRFVN